MDGPGWPIKFNYINYESANGSKKGQLMDMKPPILMGWLTYINILNIRLANKYISTIIEVA